MKKRRTGLFVLILLLTISAVSIVGTALFVNYEEKKTAGDGKLTIVTSFYPVYISAMNVTDGVKGVNLENLTEPSTGCLHDYTLKPADMKLLSKADIFLVNGGGIESFLTDVADTYPKLKIIDISSAIEKEQKTEAETSGENEVNAHYWMSVRFYRQQVQTMAEGLAKADPSHADQYQANAKAYDKKLSSLAAEEEKLSGKLPSAVVFHEAFAYLCQDIGTNVAYTLDLDEERQVSAGEARDTADALRAMEHPVILAEKTYGQEMAERMQAETGTAVIYLDPLTRSNGTYDKNGYIRGMKENLKKIENAEENNS